MDTTPTPSPTWSPTTALRPGCAIISAFTYGFYTLASRERYTTRNFAMIVLLTTTFFHRFDCLSPDHQLNTIFAHAVLFWLLHLANILFIHRDDGLALGLTPYRRAYKTIFNPRGINTSWAVVSTPKPLPPIPNPSAPSPRVAFLFAQSLIILCRYLSLSFFHGVSSALFSAPTAAPDSARPTALPWSTRTHLTLNFILHNYLLLSSLHEICSLLFVSLLGLNEPHEWPPLYGSIQSAYTIRRFWREFWHRGGYASFKGASGVVAGRIWGVEGKQEKESENGNRGRDEKGEKRRGAKGRGKDDGNGRKKSREQERGELSVRKAAEIAVAFVLSGLIQVVMDWKGGRCNVWGLGVFYFAQPVGIMVEDSYYWLPFAHIFEPSFWRKELLEVQQSRYRGSRYRSCPVEVLSPFRPMEGDLLKAKNSIMGRANSYRNPLHMPFLQSLFQAAWAEKRTRTYAIFDRLDLWDRVREANRIRKTCARKLEGVTEKHLRDKTCIGLDPEFHRPRRSGENWPGSGGSRRDANAVKRYESAGRRRSRVGKRDQSTKNAATPRSGNE
ncbi:hypothetical protein B0T14DRAFT_571588 [Immersiella caudata]|uniref:Wax synthase domain-containing protein n=1 Tax=Immersiella caudata TaxID=314043 RepID=A0AA39U3I7_9PEZI|nr:hypothetical protein B0T14DRAFT_571588 [Immersiella caudata]